MLRQPEGAFISHHALTPAAPDPMSPGLSPSSPKPGSRDVTRTPNGAAIERRLMARMEEERRGHGAADHGAECKLNGGEPASCTSSHRAW